MSVNYRTKPYPSHFDKKKCKRCKKATATRWMEADRESRSGNLRDFHVGSYCDACVPIVIAEAKKREERKQRG